MYSLTQAGHVYLYAYILVFDDSHVLCMLLLYATYFAIDWIVIGAGALSFVEVKFDCFLCQTLSTGNDTRIETQTGLTFFSGEVLQVTVYFSGFQIHNS